MKVTAADMTWPEVEEVLREPNAVLLPIGSTEQHSRHLPLNVDSLTTTHIAEQAAEKVTKEHKIRALVLPTLPYGETHGDPPFSKPFPGNIGVSVDTELRIIEDLVRSLVNQGFKNIIVLNGHKENITPSAAALRKVCIEYPNLGLYGINWFRLGMQAWRSMSKGGSEGAGHSGEKETAISLALQPENVHLDRAVKGNHSFLLDEKYISQKTPNAVYFHSCTRGERNYGIMSDPFTGTAEIGLAILSAVIDELTEIIVTIVRSEGTAVKDILP